MIIVLSAIRRSGNHALANWILPHIQDATEYTHNGSIQNLTSALKQKEGRKRSNYNIFVPFEGVMIPIRPPTGKDTNSPLLPGSTEFLINRENSMLFGVENHKPDHIKTNLKIEKKLDTFVQVIRSPWNNLASLMKYGGSLLPIEQFGEMWVKFAKEHIGETNYTEDKFKTRVFIEYDRWFSDKDYRLELSEQLGYEHTDFGLECVSSQGAGSSFDKTKMNGKAQQMKVLDRWQAAVNTEQFREVMNYPELMDLAIEIFGPPPF
jgi:hypothetical protein